MHNAHEHKPEHEERDYSDRDIPVGGIAKFGIYVAIFTAVSFVGVKLLFRKFQSDSARADQGVSTFAETRILPPAPRLLTDEPLEWKDELAAETAQIDRYAWVDANTGIVKIPIDRAMDLLAERGLPVREQPAP